MFKDWKKWFFSLPLWMKWFVILILLRPIIDQLWFLKDFGVYSPAQIVGLLFPLLVLISLIGKKIRKNHLPIPLFLFFIVVVFNFILFLYSDLSVENIGLLIRNITFVFTFVYLLAFLRNEKDFQFILITFLFSAFIPIGILYYEIIFEPISTQQLAEGRGAGIRYIGGYADVVTYAIYFIGSFIIVSYFKLRSQEQNEKYVSTTLFYFITISTVISLVYIKHTASWAVFIVIVALLLLKFLSTRKGIFIIIVPFFIGGIFYGGTLYEQHIEPLISKEITVIEGRASIDSSFNGRMRRWIYFFDKWEDMPIYAQILGVSLSDEPNARLMVSGNVHNDYIRILFLGGILGLSFYLLFLLKFFFKVMLLSNKDQFLLLSGLSFVVLYSVSAMPSYYHVLQYLFMAIVVHSIKSSS